MQAAAKRDIVVNGANVVDAIFKVVITDFTKALQTNESIIALISASKAGKFNAVETYTQMDELYKKSPNHVLALVTVAAFQAAKGPKSWNKINNQSAPSLKALKAIYEVVKESHLRAQSVILCFPETIALISDNLGFQDSWRSIGDDMAGLMVPGLWSIVSENSRAKYALFLTKHSLKLKKVTAPTEQQVKEAMASTLRYMNLTLNSNYYKQDIDRFCANQWAIATNNAKYTPPGWPGVAPQEFVAIDKIAMDAWNAEAVQVVLAPAEEVKKEG